MPQESRVRMLKLSIQDSEGRSTIVPLSDGELSIGREPGSAAAMGFVLLMISIIILFITRRYWRIPV